MELTGVSGDALRPVSTLISRLRNERPIGRLILETDPLTLRSDPNKKHTSRRWR